MIALSPLVILAVGVTVMLGMIVLRLHAFVALILAAIVVSLLSPGEPGEYLPRVAEAFGKTAGGIGIVIAMAAIIGRSLMESGAADRVVQAMLHLFGIRRAGAALATSGFILSAPVFFDTVFYLLAPLARSLYRKTDRDYLKYLMAICAGGVATHTMVPPTPGPLAVADTLGIDFGTMIVVGALIGIPMTMAGLAFGTWTNRRMPIVMRPLPGSTLSAGPADDQPLPGLLVSAVPVLLPLALIASHTLLGRFAESAADDSWVVRLATVAAVVGNANFALVLSAAAALAVYVRMRRPTQAELGCLIEESLTSGAVIILITSAGGAFGAMLKEAQIGVAIAEWFGNASQAAGSSILLLAFALSALLKFSQGSSTVAMITTSGMMGSMLPLESLPFHAAYLGAAIGSGSIVGSWVNDSGFWIFCKLGGLTETEALQAWTPLLALMGITGIAVTLVAANVLPLQAASAVVP